jgi:very-short-patch-repair endonuclease
VTGDPLIAGIAAAQHGVVTRTQLLCAGLSRRAIEHRLSQKRLHPVHRGVYLVGHPVPPPLARETAAIPACGEGAVLSHDSAAAVWGFRTLTGEPIDITLPGRSGRSRSGIRVHSARSLDPRDVRHHSGLPLTALLERSSTSLRVSRLATFSAYEQAQILRFVREADLRAALDRSPGRRGGPALRPLLDDDRKPALTRSEAEARLLGLLRAADLPPTAVNERVGRHEVDFLWNEQRLVVEVDGFAYHAHRAAFERDRIRDAELQAAGYRVIRVTWVQIESRPEAVIARLAQALARS